ncbi:ABC transporter, substrate-binding protein, aliphatic sulfonates family [Cylindrospermum stagnale PCC 7417]|uniref:Putative aliphatic sulfonates-binding protein n=1 Tax=Cylindrospermum stagnale PCC 7417 TaxID=56107 RepID=K9WT27_9NOST|nr:sulfonate ABC transporter substrate-binding protein [Cylindrospermum stagnale]AFZ22672.1 ABC transporter, substrate-binding protein, aliphatic sulfonates family [Cylindrospermum stagnale PCC 7417]
MLTKFSLSRLLGTARTSGRNALAICQKFPQQTIRSFALLFAVGLGLTLAISACSANTSDNQGTTPAGSRNAAVSSTLVRIGYQKASTILYALKVKGELEKLTASGVSVTWSEFPAGPPMLEALNAGSIDFGYTGEAPPIFAQAAGIPLVYVAYDPWSTKAEAILVPKDSPIKSVAELKGKKVAFVKGSNVNYLLVKALSKAGIEYSEIQPVTLSPADARAVFEGKKVDAWAIWDPYLAAAEAATGARILTDATGLAANRGYYLAAKSFVDKHPDALNIVLDQVKKVSGWAKNNPAEVAKLLSPALGIDASVLELAEKRHEYDVLPLTEEVISKQQEVADTFYKINLIPKQIKVKEIVWQGKQ